MLTFFAGLGLGLSLIVAIGAQNVFILRQAIRREHILAVVLVCAISDAILIVAGVAGMGAAVHALPWLIDAARWAGAAFLVGYGLLAARRAWRPSGDVLDVDDEPAALRDLRDGRGDVRDGRGDSVDPPARSGAAVTSPVAVQSRPVASPSSAPARGSRLVPVLLTCLALTWLNPHVYLDTVFLVGSVGATHGADRWIFAAGAVIGSVLWFTALGVGARHLGRWLRTPRAWRILDACVAVVMIGIALSLVLPH